MALNAVTGIESNKTETVAFNAVTDKHESGKNGAAATNLALNNELQRGLTGKEPPYVGHPGNSVFT